VFLQESIENGEEGRCFWERDRASPEVPLESWVDVEGSTCRVHGSDKHAALNNLKSQLCSVVPMLVILMLPYECNGSLSIISIEHGKIDVIDEPDELELAQRSVCYTGSLLDVLLKIGLKQGGIGVIIEVDDLL
jgi:hypothetical protein